jgi:hypothetical protein
MNSRAAIAITTSILATFAVVGCAAGEPGTDTDARVAVDTNVSPTYTPPLTAGTCPDPALGSTMPNEWYQGKATSVMQYLVGGNVPWTKEELDKIPECTMAYDATTKLRAMLENPKGGATLQAAYSDLVCTLPAALYKIDFSQEVSVDFYDQMQKTGSWLDACWGVGVSGFYYAEPSPTPGQEKLRYPPPRRVYIDPEPARLVKDLVGSTGATAAAVYTNTGTEAPVVKWPSSYINVASPPLPGTPCSVTDLASGNETLKILQGSGTWRRCY